jgi:hypothetical protein
VLGAAWMAMVWAIWTAIRMKQGGTTKMRNVLITAAILAVPLAGCMPTGPSPEAIASAKQEILACYRDAKTRVAAAKCQNAVLARFGNGDLANVLATERVALAEKIDAGAMTPAEAAAEMARVTASVNTESQQRSAAVAASMPVSCTSVGAMTTCY